MLDHQLMWLYPLTVNDELISLVSYRFQAQAQIFCSLVEELITESDIGGELVSLAQTAEVLPLIASSIFDFATNIESV
ncbi:hypothetical protein [Ktedonobacter robiniae]|uniref:Uncharacterized protein n=1 Tax=Ktedonobacter robiniae TaxID=2778365 RepID=A0ABQ3UP78_9CHLR|nr:hypothetical protein [Ktedonobacter robiniae]GHO54481.1 hypothetical protein KSB_29560 [Ktedonobacter robiniae]